MDCTFILTLVRPSTLHKNNTLMIDYPGGITIEAITVTAEAFTHLKSTLRCLQRREMPFTINVLLHWVRLRKMRQSMLAHRFSAFSV